MYGLIGSFYAHPGERDRLVALMSAGAADLPGCLSYVIARDAADPDKIWVTEVWDNRESHKASLQIPAVAATIKQAMPLIAAFGDHIETEPAGGKGL